LSSFFLEYQSLGDRIIFEQDRMLRKASKFQNFRLRISRLVSKQEYFTVLRTYRM
jgi:hypothetical protein